MILKIYVADISSWNWYCLWKFSFKKFVLNYQLAISCCFEIQKFCKFGRKMMFILKAKYLQTSSFYEGVFNKNVNINLFLIQTLKYTPLSFYSLYQYNVTSNITFWAIKKYIYSFLLTSNMSLTVFKNIHIEYIWDISAKYFLALPYKKYVTWLLNVEWFIGGCKWSRAMGENK